MEENEEEVGKMSKRWGTKRSRKKKITWKKKG